MSTEAAKPAVATNGRGTVAKPTKELKTIRDHLESAGFMAQIAKVLPKHITPERMCRVAITATTRNKDLAECDQTSFFNCMLTLSQIGLEPDGRLAHLIPFWNSKRNCYECTLIIDWKGFAQLAYRSGEVSNLHADVIYEGDLFEYDMGRIKTHVPHWLRGDDAKPKDEGKIKGAFAIAEMKDGSRPAVAMSLKAIMAIKARSKSKDKGPWVTDEPEMMKKTAFRRLSKWLPLASEKYNQALNADEDTVEDIQRVTPEPVSVERFIDRDVAEASLTHQPRISGDHVSAIQEVMDDRGIDWPQFKECLRNDKEITQLTTEAIAGFQSLSELPPKTLEFYSADECTEARRSIDLLLEGRKAA
jgi:recombination protein RecT